jgi:hypothetical protein
MGRFALVMIFLVFNLSLVFDTCFAANSSKKEQKRASAKEISHLDLLIFNASKVKNIGDWIARFTPEKERDVRRKLFKRVLLTEMPPMIRHGNYLLFFNHESKKLETLRWIKAFGNEFLFLNGKNISPYVGEPTNDWLIRLFKENKIDFDLGVSPLRKALLPPANAGFGFGLLVGAVLAGASRDSRSVSQGGSGPQTMTSQDFEKLGDQTREVVASEFEKRFPGLAAREEAKQVMQSRVLSAMREGYEIACIDGGKFAGARFTTEIDGQKVLFRSRPSSESTSFNLIVSDQKHPKASADFLINQTTGSYTLRWRNMGGRAPSAQSGNVTKYSDDGVLNSLSVPFLSKPNVALKEDTFSDEETTEINKWLNGPGAKAKANLRVCRNLERMLAYSPERRHRGYRRKMPVYDGEEIEHEYLRDHDHDHDYARFKDQEVLMDLKGLDGQEIIAGCERLRKIGKDRLTRSGQPLAFNPWGQQWRASGDLDFKISKEEEELKKLNGRNRDYINEKFCRHLEDFEDVSLRRYDLERRSLATGGRSTRSGDDACMKVLKDQMQEENPELAKKVYGRSQDIQEFNREARGTNKENAATSAEFGEAAKLAEAATACCRVEECRGNMKTESTVNRRKGRPANK